MFFFHGLPKIDRVTLLSFLSLLQVVAPGRTPPANSLGAKSMRITEARIEWWGMNKNTIYTGWGP